MSRVGRIVRYRVAEGEESHMGAPAGISLPAVIVVDFGNCVNLKVHTNATFDVLKCSVGESNGLGGWHWPERVPEGEKAVAGG